MSEFVVLCKGCTFNLNVDDSNLVLLGTFTLLDAESEINNWTKPVQKPSSTNGHVEIYVCPEEKAWMEKQCSSDI